MAPAKFCFCDEMFSFKVESRLRNISFGYQNEYLCSFLGLCHILKWKSRTSKYSRQFAMLDLCNTSLQKLKRLIQTKCVTAACRWPGWKGWRGRLPSGATHAQPVQAPRHQGVSLARCSWCPPLNSVTLVTHPRRASFSWDSQLNSSFPSPIWPRTHGALLCASLSSFNQGPGEKWWGNSVLVLLYSASSDS